MGATETAANIRDFAEKCWREKRYREPNNNSTEAILHSMLVRWSQSFYTQQLPKNITQEGWHTFFAAAVAIYRSNDKTATSPEIRNYVHTLQNLFSQFSFDIWLGRARAYALLIIPELVKAMREQRYTEEDIVFTYLPTI